jgi:hypothetical protein
MIIASAAAAFKLEADDERCVIHDGHDVAPHTGVLRAKSGSIRDGVRRVSGSNPHGLAVGARLTERL